jgi:hypothetical protein
MAMTNSERQAAFRQRRDARIREMEEKLRNHSEAPKAVRGADEREEIAGLRAELAAVQRTLGLADVKASNKRLRNGESIALVMPSSIVAKLPSSRFLRRRPDRLHSAKRASKEPGLSSGLNTE